MSKVLHLKGLNGIRALAAIAVVIAHITGDLSHFGLPDTIFGADSNGNRTPILMASYGVTMFFALSGFLITYLLLLEHKLSNTIGVGNFYIRRILRIWPLYFLYFFVVICIYSLFNIYYDNRMIPFYIFLTANIPLIINQSLPFLGHLWSIGVEEQFYLFWPWVAKSSISKILKFSIAFFIIFYLMKIVFYAISIKYGITIPITAMTVTRFNIMMIGCIGAIIYYNKSSLLTYFCSKWVQLLCWLILVFATLNKFHISSALVDHEVIAIITVLIIFAQITRTNYLIDLDNRVLNFIGKISYGIYVIHPLIILLSFSIIPKFNDATYYNYLLVYFLIIGSTVLVSYISYNFYEKRFIMLKSKFARIKSTA